MPQRRCMAQAAPDVVVVHFGVLYACVFRAAQQHGPLFDFSRGLYVFGSSFGSADYHMSWYVCHWHKHMQTQRACISTSWIMAIVYRFRQIHLAIWDGWDARTFSFPFFCFPFCFLFHLWLISEYISIFRKPFCRWIRYFFQRGRWFMRQTHTEFYLHFDFTRMKARGFHFVFFPHRVFALASAVDTFGVELNKNSNGFYCHGWAHLIFFAYSSFY